MAESQRKSGDAVVVKDTDVVDRKNLIFLLAVPFGGVAAISGMMLLAGFLSGDEAGPVSLGVFAATAIIAAVLFSFFPIKDRLEARKNKTS